MTAPLSSCTYTDSYLIPLTFTAVKLPKEKTVVIRRLHICLLSYRHVSLIPQEVYRYIERTQIYQRRVRIISTSDADPSSIPLRA